MATTLQVGQKVRFVGGENSSSYRSTPDVGAEGTVVNTAAGDDRIFVVFPDFDLPISDEMKMVSGLIFGHLPGYDPNAWPLLASEVEAA